MTDEIKAYDERMKKQIGAYEHELAAVRAGRANPSVLDRIHADYYGVPTLISQMAEIKIPDARTLMITPWDASSLKAIEKAINASDLGINPNNDGKSIRLVFPTLTEERRRELARQLAKMGEEVKVHLRNIRREANDKFKDMKKKSDITEDDQKELEKEIQTLTNDYIKSVDAITASKDKELMSI